MMLRLANAGMHAVHLVVIAFTLVGWAFPETRALHLVVCGLTLFSWFILGPLCSKQGFCFLTGIQHWIWGQQRRPESINYMSFLYQQLCRRRPSPREMRWIDIATQAALYTCTLLSLLLIL